LLAITADTKDCEDITVNGVTGKSITSNGVRLEKDAPTSDVRTLRNITVTGVNVHDVGANGLIINPDESNANFDNVTVKGKVRNPGAAGASINGSLTDCEFDLQILSPSGLAVDATATDINNSRFEGTIRNPPTGNYAAEFNNMDNSVVDFNSYRSASDSTIAHVVVTANSAGNKVTGVYEGGGFGIFPGESGQQTDDTTISDVIMKDVSTPVIDGGGAFSTMVEDYQFLNCGDMSLRPAQGASDNGVCNASYTGDGTTGRTISLGWRPSKVFVEGSDGTLYEVRDDSLSPIDGVAPSGELSIVDDGFTVGDNGADADPNTDTETYQFGAWR
jgi:hypothetical protein